MNVWIDVAVVAGIFAVGNILFGHFESGTPKWRRVLKFVLVTGATALIASVAGHAGAALFVAALAAIGLSFHHPAATRHQSVDSGATRQVLRASRVEGVT